MKFCEDCSNMLFPRNGKLYCNLCDKYYEMTEKEAKSTKRIIHEEGYGKLVIK